MSWDHDLDPYEIAIDGNYECLRDHYVRICPDHYRRAELTRQLHIAYDVWIRQGLAEIAEYLETM